MDAIFIEVPASKVVNSLDWRAGTTTGRQVSTTNLPGGVDVCSSGAYESEICGITTYGDPYNGYCSDKLVSERFQIQYTACGLVRAAKTGQVAAGIGDSGGPVYRVTSQGGLDIVGIVTAIGNFLSWCPNQAAGLRKCSDTLYYTELGPILRTNSLQLKTS